MGGRFHTVTLGCKLNQFDSAALEGELAARGLAPTDDPAAADVLVVNTCTVTHRADADARKIVRRLRRGNPRGALFVTGCYAERDAGALRALPEVDHVFGNRQKHTFGAILDAAGVGDGTAGARNGDRGCDGGLVVPRALHFGRRSRAFLRVQDGCRLACSYCIIPEVRGRSRSVPADDLAEAARRLWGRGYREVVLTGVNTGDWGRDLSGGRRLIDLLDRLLEDAGNNRIRLNSLEPRTVTDGVIERMATDSRLAPHLQVPLQSGSDTVLQRMRRNYRIATYLERVERLRAEVPSAGIGADVIVGFPGETDAEFQETHDAIAGSPLNYLHVFSWSPRPGTDAATLQQRLPERVIGERNRALRDLADQLSLGFRRTLVGRVLDALVLEPADDGRLRALTGNFVEVRLPAGAALAGDLVDVRVVTASRADTTAELADPAPRATASGS